MKWLVVLLALGLSPCCTSPNRAYFRSYPTRTTTTQIQEIAVVSSPTPLPVSETLEASAASHLISQPIATELPKATVPFKKISGTDRKALVSAIRDYRLAMKADKGDTGGDKKKNVFAFGGLAASVIGLVVLVAMIGGDTFTPGLLIVGLSISGLGVLLSLIGRKSERRKIGSIGLWIGLGTLTIAAIIGILSAIYNSIS